MRELLELSGFLSHCILQNVSIKTTVQNFRYHSLLGAYSKIRRKKKITVRARGSQKSISNVISLHSYLYLPKFLELLIYAF